MKEKERCDFCDLTIDEAKFMVAGAGGIHICNECIETCMEMWEAFRTKEKKIEAYVIKQRLNDNLTK